MALQDCNSTVILLSVLIVCIEYHNCLCWVEIFVLGENVIFAGNESEQEMSQSKWQTNQTTLQTTVDKSLLLNMPWMDWKYDWLTLSNQWTCVHKNRGGVGGETFLDINIKYQQGCYKRRHINWVCQFTGTKDTCCNRFFVKLTNVYINKIFFW